MRRVGIVGYGALGRTLAAEVQGLPDHELAFVWNRTPGSVPAGLPVLEDLADAGRHDPDLIVEVSHPDVCRTWGVRFLAVADLLVGSPTVLADLRVERELRGAAAAHGLYVPRGALPGLGDILDLASEGAIAGASITMRKHPLSVKFDGPLPVRLDQVTHETEIFRGSVRELCPLAPNNVNTMAVLALASGLGFDAVEARLVVDPALTTHVTEVTVLGPVDPRGARFSLELRRTNPAATGAVTGAATHRSFARSLVRAQGRGPGLHLV